MAMSPDVRYISYYTDGSAARKVERRPAPKVTAAPKPVAKPQKRVVVPVDPVAVVGIVLAAVMLVSMLSACIQYRSVTEKNARLGQYILSLQQEQEALRQEYKAGYDIEQIRQIADALGMVPLEEANRITVEVQIPEQTQSRLSFWDTVTIFLAELFA